MKKIQKIAILGATDNELKLIRRKIILDRSIYEYDKFLLHGRYNGLEVLLLETGVGDKKIQYRIQQLLKKYPIDLAIFIGFIGALKKDMEVGDVIVPGRLISASHDLKEYCPSLELINLSKMIICKGIRVYFDEVNLTVEKMYLRNDKIKLMQTNPIVSSIDMEAFEIAEIFFNKKIPFIVIKAVSDKWDFFLAHFNFLCSLTCKNMLSRLLLYGLQYPLEIIGLIRFMADCKKALKNNLKFLEKFLDNLK